MLDVSVAYNRYKFLGYEFLTWIWYTMEEDREKLHTIDPELVSLDIGNKIILENCINDAVESITIKGDEADLKEGFLALRKGAVVTEIHLSYKSGDHQWLFTIKGESLNISNLKTPETGPVEKKEDLDAAVLEKVFLYEKVVVLIDNIYKHFIHLRVSGQWDRTVVPKIKKWVAA